MHRAELLEEVSGVPKEVWIHASRNAMRVSAPWISLFTHLSCSTLHALPLSSFCSAAAPCAPAEPTDSQQPHCMDPQAQQTLPLSQVAAQHAFFPLPALVKPSWSGHAPACSSTGDPSSFHPDTCKYSSSCCGVWEDTVVRARSPSCAGRHYASEGNASS